MTWSPLHLHQYWCDITKCNKQNIIQLEMKRPLMCSYKKLCITLEAEFGDAFKSFLSPTEICTTVQALLLLH